MLVFVHFYKYSHENLRKKYKKLLKQGKVAVFDRNKEGICYKILPKENHATIHSL